MEDLQVTNFGVEPKIYREYAKKNNETFGDPTIWGGTIGTATFQSPIMPTGYPIQFGYAQSTVTGSTVNTGTEFYIFQGSITPQFSDSTIYALGAVNGLSNESSGRLFIKLRAGGTSAGTSGSNIGVVAVAQDSNATSGLSSAFVAGTYAHGGTSPVYFKIILEKGDAGGTPSGYINRYNEQSSIILVEVK